MAKSTTSFEQIVNAFNNPKTKFIAKEKLVPTSPDDGLYNTNMTPDNVYVLSAVASILDDTLLPFIENSANLSDHHKIENMTMQQVAAKLVENVPLPDKLDESAWTMLVTIVEDESDFESDEPTIVIGERRFVPEQIYSDNAKSHYINVDYRIFQKMQHQDDFANLFADMSALRENSRQNVDPEWGYYFGKHRLPLIKTVSDKWPLQFSNQNKREHFKTMNNNVVRNAEKYLILPSSQQVIRESEYVPKSDYLVTQMQTTTLARLGDDANLSQFKSARMLHWFRMLMINHAELMLDEKLEGLVINIDHRAPIDRKVREKLNQLSLQNPVYQATGIDFGNHGVGQFEVAELTFKLIPAFQLSFFNTTQDKHILGVNKYTRAERMHQSLFSPHDSRNDLYYDVMFDLATANADFRKLLVNHPHGDSSNDLTSISRAVELSNPSFKPTEKSIISFTKRDSEDPLTQMDYAGIQHTKDRNTAALMASMYAPNLENATVYKVDNELVVLNAIDSGISKLKFRKDAAYLDY